MINKVKFEELFLEFFENSYPDYCDALFKGTGSDKIEDGLMDIINRHFILKSSLAERLRELDKRQGNPIVWTTSFEGGWHEAIENIIQIIEESK